MPEFSAVPRRSHSQQILSIRREHWDRDRYDPNARRLFQRALQCKTPALGRRVYASENEEREFCNTCKVSVACTSCGHRATTHWQRERDFRLPNVRYLSITFTMPSTLWPFFAANPKLCRKLAVIAARVIKSYARVRKSSEVGVIAVLQTFNGRMQFNPHVHTLVTAGDLPTTNPGGPSSIFFDPNQLRDSWQRLVLVLLRGVMQAGQLRFTISRDEVERLLQEEQQRKWYRTHVQADDKEHFLSYGGRYLRRPPFAEQNILDVAEGFVRFCYKDKQTRRREVLRYTIEEFIDLWAQHLPGRYRHGPRYFGLFAPRRWAQEGAAVFTILGTQQRPRPKRIPWAIGVQELGGVNPLVDNKGQSMRFVRHLAPLVT